MVSFFRFPLAALGCLLATNVFAQNETPKLSIIGLPDRELLSVSATFADKQGVAVLFQASAPSTIKGGWLPVHAFPTSEASRAMTQMEPTGNIWTFFRLEEHDMAVPETMIWLPPGNFVMGSPTDETQRYKDEGPQRMVTIGRGYWTCKYEVTQGEFLQLMNTNPSRAKSSDKLPVERVTWDEAMEYCKRLNERETQLKQVPKGYTYRLPTETEWEYAARAGTTTAYSYGEDVDHLSEHGWWMDNSGPEPSPVGLLKPNPWGLYDMHGNVFEWCLDEYNAYPEGSAPSAGFNLKVTRGGAFYCPSNILRSACRTEPQQPDYRNMLTGFRVFLAPKL